MELVGYLDSPYVRRVAITMHFLGIKFTHRELSIFRSYDEFRTVNPLVKIPTLICDDGHVLVDSTLIIDYLESLSSDKTLVPAEPQARRDNLEYTGVALVAMEKVVQLIYELKHRPPEKQHEPWQTRVREQLVSACELLEQTVVKTDPGYLERKYRKPISPLQSPGDLRSMYFRSSLTGRTFQGWLNSRIALKLCRNL